MNIRQISWQRWLIDVSLVNVTPLTVAQYLRQAVQLQALSDSPRLDVELLLAWVLQKNRTFLFTWPETLLSEAQQLQFDSAFQRRLQGEPVAHILGEREFWSLPISVNATTLIPRPDTELLVATALEIFADDDKNRPRQLLDLGTGTGAIALALASEKPGWQCVGVDRVADAVALAEFNRNKLSLPNAHFLQSNWFEAIAAEANGDSSAFDIIVSNPPYIDPQDPHLQQGDVRFEPLSALVAEQQGLADIQFIIEQSPAFLRPGGWLLIEHGYDQGDAARALFTARGFQHCETRKDYGGNDRVTLGQWFSGEEHIS